MQLRPFLRALLTSAILFSVTHNLGAERTAGYLRQAGPMIGHVGDSSAVVWLRAKMGTEISATASQGGQTFSPSKIEDLTEGFYRIHFAGLKPQTETSVAIELSRPDAETEQDKVSFTTAPAPASTGTVKIAFGSCAKVSHFGGAPIFDAIADEKPDFFIFAGDNVYFIVGDGSKRHFATTGPTGDWTFYETMLARHLEMRVHPDLDRLHRTIPTYAVWDDHDYGPNNADATFPMKEEATRAFTRVWANPGFGTADTGGIFSSFRHGPVEVFLMDDRSFKYSPFEHDDVTPETGRIWGEKQLDWLLDGLRRSTAPVKLIANGTQFLGQDYAKAEGHSQEARQEQQRLLDFLASERIDGVVFLTGDRHHSAVYQQAQGDGTLVLDLTSSPLQQNQKLGPHRSSHPNQLWNMRGNSYGLVTVEIPEEGGGMISFEARDESNQIPVIGGVPRTAQWQLDQLNY